MVADKEVGKQGTPHLHVYIRLKTKKRLSAMKEMHGEAHWEPVKDRKACIAYCSKGETFVNKVTGYHHSDSAQALSLALSGGLAAVASEFPQIYLRHSRALAEYRRLMLSAVQRQKPAVSWLWGPTGVGKSKMAREGREPNQIYTQYGPNSKGAAMWWDGYEGQERVIMDDFRPWWCPFSFLLALLDRYQMQVQVKGGFVNFVPLEIIITTTSEPATLFSGAYRSPEDIRQLERRIDSVVAM